MKEHLETNRMSHCPRFYGDFFLQQLNFKDWIFHSAVSADQNYVKHAGMMKTMLDTNIYGYLWMCSYFQIVAYCFSCLVQCFSMKPDIFVY